MVEVRTFYGSLRWRARSCALAGLWLLGGCRDAPPPDVMAPDSTGPGFVDVSEALNLDFQVERPVEGDYFMPDSMGAGGALLDYDRDGDLDVYVVNGFRDREGRLETPEGANRLYRREAAGRFIDVTSATGAGDTGYGMGVAVGDIDNDGFPDLFVSNYGQDRLYHNDGAGTFTDVTQQAGITSRAWGASAGFFDFDNDGFLDLFVTQYLDYDPAVCGSDAAGRPEYASPSVFRGVPDVLYRNNGDGTFRDVSAEAGFADKPGKGLGVVFLDLNADGHLDVYVANDGEPNFAWISDGAGRFRDEAMRLGLAVNGYGQPEAGMGIACGDCDNDGELDLLVTHLVRETNTLYRQGAGGLFHDDTAASGLRTSSLNATGFGTAFLDVELDGDLDLLWVNGRVLRGRPVGPTPLSRHWAPYAEHDDLHLNDGTGRFADGRTTCGDLCRAIDVGRGLAPGDIDGDGDLDVLVVNGSGNARLYRNELPHRGRWLVVRTLDPARNRDAIGAIVTVRAGERRWRRDIAPAGSYLSSSPPVAHFGLGPVDSVDAIGVTWPGGGVEEFEGGAVDRVVALVKGEGRSASRSP